MDKLKVFISSRVNSAFVGLDAGFSLKELRQWLKDSLEAEIFLGEQILDVVINETDFDSTIAKNAFDNCMSIMRTCNIIIVLFNGEAGWSVTDNNSTNGICHEEFLIAANEFSDMAFILDLSSFFPASTINAVKKRNDEFIKDITSSFPHKETIDAKTIAELKEKVLKQIKRYILKATTNSFTTQKRIVSGSSVFGETLDWNKLSYSERQEALELNLETAFNDLPIFKDVVKAYHAIPDNMSVADARNLIGRPFINEHRLIESSVEKSGAIHFVAVYGNATETQAKNLVGYPDLAVIKAPFGYYLWEKNMHIQMFFLRHCINSQTVKTRLSEMINWLSSSREQSKILARAKARYSILDAMNKSKKIVGM